VQPDLVIAIDIGGTGMKCALADEAGNFLHTERHPTPAGAGPQAVVTAILDVAAGLAHRAGTAAQAAGVVVAGVVDEPAGTVVWSANLGLRGVPLRDLIAQRLLLPVTIGHDVRAGGVAEARLGAGRGHDQMLFVAVGTGIAAAHVVHGTTTSGAHGGAGELGHVIVEPNGQVCGCGGRGCLETLASASALARAYAARTGRAATAAQIAAALGHDIDAAAVWRAGIDALAGGLRTAITLYDPEIVVIGGGLADAGPALLEPLTEAVAARLTFQRLPAIVGAVLGDRAGCLGAALLARDAMTPRVELGTGDAR
jgi:glucokinase